ncbi:MAG: hypothetical protein F4118_10050 [Acidimicrobiaceae bacterium]|nr:hypothetical protein [Candidatus Poribacteria bacterium]MYI36751.1 hypothetical protein [Acidimicrobiaceae bacterium]
MAYSRDENYNMSTIRTGTGIGGYIDIPDGQTSGWNRLFPSGNTGSFGTDEDKQINIGSLRSDIAEITDWHLRILNPGYIGKYDIASYANNIVTLKYPMHYEVYNGLKNSGASNAIHWVIYPNVLNPFAINFKSLRSGGSNDMLEIGVAKEDAYAPDVLLREKLRDGESVNFFFKDVDKIFYKPDQNEGEISWGEQPRNQIRN